MEPLEDLVTFFTSRSRTWFLEIYNSIYAAFIARVTLWQTRYELVTIMEIFRNIENAVVREKKEEKRRNIPSHDR